MSTTSIPEGSRLGTAHRRRLLEISGPVRPHEPLLKI